MPKYKLYIQINDGKKTAYVHADMPEELISLIDKDDQVETTNFIAEELKPYIEQILTNLKDDKECHKS